MTVMSRMALFGGAAALLGLFAQPSIAAEPAVPPGLDPGGVAIALPGDGIDYTRPEIAARLARDGEGDLIAWDFSDNDTQPFAASSRLEGNVEQLLALSSAVRLVIVKEAANDPVAIGRMVSFVAQTPARIVLCPDAHSRSDAAVFDEAVRRFPQLLFITSRQGNAGPQGALPANLAVAKAARAEDATAGALALAVKAAALLAADPAMKIADLKRAISP
jgi:hypothetical protein